MDWNELFSVFDQNVFARGMDYFERGRVTKLKETAAGTFKAAVQGHGGTYRVSVDMNDMSFRCNCPYQFGPCKHVAAMLLAIKDLKIEADTEDNTQSNSDASLSVEQLISRLAPQPKEELLRLLDSLVRQYSEVREELAVALARPEERLSCCRDLIRGYVLRCQASIYTSASARSEIFHGLDKITKQLEESKSHADDGERVDFALMLAQELLEIRFLADVLKEPAYRRLEPLMAVIGEISRRVTEASEDGPRKALFDKLLKAAQAPAFNKTGHYAQTLLEYGLPIAERVPALRDRYLSAFLRSLTPGGERRFSSNPKAFTRYINLLKQWKGLDAVIGMAVNSLSDVPLCTSVLAVCLEEREYARALQLCLKAERAVKNERQSLRVLMKKRYDIYSAVNQTEAMRMLAREFVFMGEKDYYDRLKALYTEAEWPPVREELLNELEKNAMLNDVYLYAIKSDLNAPRLIRYIEAHPYTLDQCAASLLPEYAQDVCRLYLDRILSLAEDARERGAYHVLAQVTESFAAVCGPEPTRILIHAILAKYPKKSSLRAELDVVLKELDEPAMLRKRKTGERWK